MDLTLGLLSGHWSHLCLAWCISRIEAFIWGKKSKKIVLTSSGLPRSIDTPLQQQQTCPTKETPCGFPNWKLGQSADHAGQVAQQRAWSHGAQARANGEAARARAECAKNQIDKEAEKARMEAAKQRLQQEGCSRMRFRTKWSLWSPPDVPAIIATGIGRTQAYVDTHFYNDTNTEDGQRKARHINSGCIFTWVPR